MGGDLVGYIDGEQVGSDPTSGFTVIDGNNDAIGIGRGLVNHPFTGPIGGTMAWNRDLPGAEIQDKYQATKPLYVG